MELQNQIYLLIAVFGGLLVLMVVLIVVLSVYVRKTRKLFTNAKYGHSNDKFNGVDFAGEDNMRQREVGALPNHGYRMEMNDRTDYRSDLTKTRNDYGPNLRNINHNRAYRGDGETNYPGNHRSEKAKANARAAPENRVPEDPFEAELSNIFDMEDLNEDLVDRDSVGDGRDARYISPAGMVGSSVGDQNSMTNIEYGRGGATANHPSAGGINRFHNPHAGKNGKRKNGTNGAGALGDIVEGEQQSNSYYNAGKEHGPYYTARRMKY